MSKFLNDKARSLLASTYPSAVSADTNVHELSKNVYPNVEVSKDDEHDITNWLEKSSEISKHIKELNTHLASKSTIQGTHPSIADVAVYANLAPIVATWTDEQRTGKDGSHHIVRYIDFVQNSPVFGLNVMDGSKVKINVNDVVSKIPIVDAKAEKERKKKEKEAASTNTDPASSATTTAQSIVEKVKDLAISATSQAASALGLEDPVAAAAPKQSKKEKKEKAPKNSQPAASATPSTISPALIDLRVGHILKCIPHPNADSLYVSTMAVGDAEGTENTSVYEGQVCRTVCSGLNGLVPLAEMQGRKVVAVCNLKPVTMRGIKSAAMVLAASPRPNTIAGGEEMTDEEKEKEKEREKHAGPVELVSVPAESNAGERVFFDGWNDGEPEKVLNPKKKIWETLQPGFTTTVGLEVGFDSVVVGDTVLGEKAKNGGVALLKTIHGLCKVKTLTNAVVR